MVNKSILALSKANPKTYKSRLVRRNSANGASDEEALKMKVSKLPTRATKRKVVDSSSEEPTSSNADGALKTVSGFIFSIFYNAVLMLCFRELIKKWSHHLVIRSNTLLSWAHLGMRQMRHLR